MKPKIAILTDSSSAIYSCPHAYANLFMIDLPCFLGDQIYTDFSTNQNDVFFKALETTHHIPKTSQPSVGEMLAMYEHIREQGYTDVIFLPISRELSGTYQNAHLAKDIVKGMDITIVDTLTCASILLEMALSAAGMASRGATKDEILTHIETLKNRWGYYVVVSDLTALVKNGRLSNAKSMIANLFNIKPIIQFNKQGKLVALQNVRTYKKALKTTIDLVAKEASPKSIIHLAYAKESPEVEMVYNLLQEALSEHQVIRYILPATIVAHVGLGTIGIGYLDTSL